MHPQLRSSRPYIAQQCSAAQCGAVPCRSFCGAVSCGGVRSCEHTAVSSIVVPGMIQVPDVCGRVVYSSFCFLQLSVLSRSPCSPPHPRQYHTYCRSERDINEHTAQRRAITSAQASLGIINSLAFARNNHGPLLPAPCTCFSCMLPCWSEVGGVSSPRSGALCFLQNHKEYHQVLGVFFFSEVPATRYR